MQGRVAARPCPAYALPFHKHVWDDTRPKRSTRSWRACITGRACGALLPRGCRALLFSHSLTRGTCTCRPMTWAAWSRSCGACSASRSPHPRWRCLWATRRARPPASPPPLGLVSQPQSNSCKRRERKRETGRQAGRQRQGHTPLPTATASLFLQTTGFDCCQEIRMRPHSLRSALRQKTRRLRRSTHGPY